MNEKQRWILTSIFSGKSGFDNLSSHFKGFVEKEIETIGSPKWWQLWNRHLPSVITAEEVLRYFHLMASELDLSKSPLTIEQMLHIAVVDLVFYSNRGKRVSLKPAARLRAKNLLTLPRQEDALGDYGEVLVADTKFELTPALLSSEVAPYIDALEQIQRIIGRHRYYSENVRIRLIKQASPIDISLDGAADAINALKEDIIPWRKRTAQKLAELKAKELEVEIEKKKAEAATLKTGTIKDQAEAERILAEAEKAKAEADKIRLENKKLSFEIESAQFQLALDIATKMRPELSEREKVLLATQLLPSVQTLAFSSLEFGPPQNEKPALLEGEIVEDDEG